MWSKSSRDHNATSYSTETKRSRHFRSLPQRAEIITLRAIALKPHLPNDVVRVFGAEIITLRAIALKHFTGNRGMGVLYAEIITLRAIALKH